MSRTAVVGGFIVATDATTTEPTTILIEDGVITAVTPGVHTHDGAHVIDARGQWVMPGLVDMHAHLWDVAQGPSLLAHGITTVRDMWGSPAQLTWRSDIAEGRLDGPALVCASPLIEGRLADGKIRYPFVDPVDDPDSAVRRTVEHAAAGYDAIKVYSGLDAARLAAICLTAREHDLPVVGHVPSSMKVADAVALGLHGVEHLGEWQNDCLVPGTVLPRPFSERVLTLVERTDWDSVRRLADALASAGATVCPTLGVWGVVADSATDHDDDPNLRLAPASAKALWSRNATRPAVGESPSDVRNSARRLRDHVAAVVVILHDHGVRIVVGTDGGSIWTVAGPSYADELRYLNDVLPTKSVLAAATTAAADDLGRCGPGALRPGGRADLLVLDSDPRLDVTAPTRARHVVAHGVVHDRDRLTEAVAHRVSTVDAALDADDDCLGPMGRRAWFARGKPG